MKITNYLTFEELLNQCKNKDGIDKKFDRLMMTIPVLRIEKDNILAEFVFLKSTGGIMQVNICINNFFYRYIELDKNIIKDFNNNDDFVEYCKDVFINDIYNIITFKAAEIKITCKDQEYFKLVQGMVSDSLLKQRPYINSSKEERIKLRHNNPLNYEISYEPVSGEIIITLFAELFEYVAELNIISFYYNHPDTLSWLDDKANYDYMVKLFKEGVPNNTLEIILNNKCYGIRENNKLINQFLSLVADFPNNYFETKINGDETIIKYTGSIIPKISID